MIIIPAYNEEKTIVPVLEKLEQPEIAQIADVLVMHDASSAATNHVTKKRVACSLDISMQCEKITVM